MVWSESNAKANMVKSVQMVGGYATRVEDKYRVGVLDLIFVLGGKMVLAEAKVVKSSFIQPSPRQGVEMRDIQRAGGTAILIGVTQKGDYYFTQETLRAPLSECTHYPPEFGPFAVMLKHYLETSLNERQ